ncbi:hypothetical protein CCACVL1_23785 [Corchorus capsularis]|uniref:HAT C-terminal dimerisation domain-containing protein n=1 Tax=Corchorus capsularis TaxID=210143 RepID=A0A1R3GSD3_COCAP|nr:hypothetical protein CCACVL1_23785 [Corchorus capsularis]
MNPNRTEEGTEKLDQKLFRESVALEIIEHGPPFSYAEYEGSRRSNRILNPNVEFFSRNTLKAEVLKVHNKLKEDLKNTLHKLSSRICLTSDMWTSCQNRGYLSLTAHYVDENWKLCSKVLNFCHVPPPDRANNLCGTIHGLLRDWGIEKKIFTITLDNARNMDNMQELLRSKLVQQDGLLSRGAYFHIRCSAHILNLIVQDGLKVLGDALEKARESVKWNSTYLMLERFLLYVNAFKILPTEDPTFLMEDLPTEEELHKIEYICNFLKPFYDITTLFLGVDYPTANLYFENVCKVRSNLLKEIESPDSCLREVAKAMKEKFDKYWNEHCVVLAFAVILDPRFKLKFVKFYLKKFDDNFENKAKSILDKLKALFKEYESASSSSGGNCDIQGGGKELDQSLIEFQSYESDDSTSSNKSQLELYLEEPRVLITMPYDVLAYWKDNYARYPELATMARDIMTIPITTVASESTFSMGGRVVNQWRSSLTCKNAEALITTRNWLHGYTTKDDRSKATHVSISSLSQQASNVVD